MVSVHIKTWSCCVVQAVNAQVVTMYKQHKVRSHMVGGGALLIAANASHSPSAVHMYMVAHVPDKQASIA